MTFAETTHSLFVTYHVFCVADGDHWPAGDIPFEGNGLVHPFPGGAYVFTGIHTGPVNIRIRRLSGAPVDLDLGEWEEIAEVSVEPRRGTLRVRSLEHGDDGPVIYPQSVVAAQRVRVYAKGRDTASDESVETAVEDYLIEIWQEEHSGEVVHRQTDEYGAELRAM
jgi:hypothetical protein